MSASLGRLARLTAAVLVAPIIIVGSITPTSASASDLATLSGVVTFADTSTAVGAGDVAVTAYRSGAVGPYDSTVTDEDGRYEFTVATGFYQLHFDYLPSNEYADEWSVDAPAKSVSSGVSLTLTGRTFDVQLERGAALSGTLLLPDGSPADDATVTIERFFDFQNNPWHRISYSTETNNDGYWEFTGLPAAAYTVRLWTYTSRYHYLVDYWEDSYTSPLGNRVELAVGETRAGLDHEYFANTRIYVRFSCSICDTPALHFVIVRYQWQYRATENEPWVTVKTSSSTYSQIASMTVSARAPGQYRVIGSFASDSDWGYGATAVATVDEGDQVTLPFAVMSRPVPDRIFGANRFETTAKVAEQSHPGTSSVVYIANGMTFADALSAGPAAAAAGAPMLLVTATSVPEATRQALTRLDPDTIIVVGGVSAVSAAVEAQLSLYAPVERYWGANRYETSRRIAEQAFPEGSEIVYIATGQSFPDALSAGAVAGTFGAPLVTVNGMASALDTATRALLIELGARDIRIVGGTGAVSAGIESGLLAVPGIESVERFAGPDRYSTSLAVSQALDNSPYLFLAVGTSFADALGGGHYAAATGSPLVVVPRTCVPAGVLEYLRSLRPDRVVLLGGASVLGTGVESLTPCG